MADLPLDLRGGLADRLAHALDQEGKIPRALEALGPLGGREVALVDAAGGIRARQLAALGARLRVVACASCVPEIQAGLHDLFGPPAPVELVVGDAESTGLADASIDALVAYWSAYRPPAVAAVAEADRVLRPDGRLLIVHDYGRDDVSLLVGDRPEYGAWSRRGGWYLRHGFRMHIVHSFWSFASLDEVHAFIDEAFPATAPAVAAGLRRPRLSYNVAIYHRTRGETGRPVESPGP